MYLGATSHRIIWSPTHRKKMGEKATVRPESVELANIHLSVIFFLLVSCPSLKEITSVYRKLLP